MDPNNSGSVGSPRRPGMIDRRTFVKYVGATFGSAAALNLMTAWGQLPEGQINPPELDGNGEGTKVIVLGAGPGGCAAAYELMNAGYDVTVLEARDYVGGHVLTVRDGTRTQEYGLGEQVAEGWPEGGYFDAGPSRIPFFHNGFFHYAREFNIPLIDYNNLNDNAYVYAEGIGGNLDGTRMRLAEFRADISGYTAQYLATAADQNALDGDLSADDLELFRNYLVSWGMLDPEDLEYVESGRRGYTKIPDANGPGEYGDAHPAEDMIPYAAGIMRTMSGYLAATPSRTWQSTLVAPAEGIGQLYEQGFQRALGDRIRLNCEVTEIRQSDEGVRIVFLNKETGETEEIEGDYAMCNIPLSVLIKIPSDFSPEFTEAIRSVPYDMALRLGLAFKRRFWEEDDWIYGGQSFSNIPELGIIGYPNDNYNAESGVLLGMYNFGANAARVSSLDYEARNDLALEYGSKIHPQMRDEYISGFSVAWHLEPYSLGAWPNYYSQELRDRVMPVIQEPEGRVYLVGEHLSYVNSWIEGAHHGAWMMVEKLHQRVMQG
jgi:monoamine oxidase